MTKAEAQQRGKALLKRLKGDGWKLDVWKNIWWCYAIRGSNISVHRVHEKAGKATSYYAFVGENGSSGLAMWTGKGGYFADPNRAVRYAIQNAEACLEELRQIVDNAKATAGLTKAKGAKT